MAGEALIVVDAQIDFCPGGALAVAEGDQVIGPVNALIARFDHVIMTQDWHPAGHSSFASAHPGKTPFETLEMPYGAQVLWPDHCIQGTAGAAFHPALEWTKAEMLVRKGFHRDVDSYSAFFENDHKTPTGLVGYLGERGIRAVTLVGLATDYCVAYSALDARQSGFEATVIMDACRAIDLEGSLATMTKKMKEAGVVLA
jgi:nicotinamidase/pyrazinamidase